MGAIANAIAAYTQPLLDSTDGSVDQMNRALALGQLCWNLALLPEQARDASLATMRPRLKLDDDEFEAFRRSVLIPMIRRHEDMFPRMRQRGSTQASREGPRLQPRPTTPTRTERYPGTGAMRHVLATVGESTSVVVDDEPSYVVANLRLENQTS